LWRGDYYGVNSLGNVIINILMCKDLPNYVPPEPYVRDSSNDKYFLAAGALLFAILILTVCISSFGKMLSKMKRPKFKVV
jgi:hypothetical protein